MVRRRNAMRSKNVPVELVILDGEDRLSVIPSSLNRGITSIFTAEAGKRLDNQYPSALPLRESVATAL
jgi:hypothetical protein